MGDHTFWLNECCLSLAPFCICFSISSLSLLLVEGQHSLPRPHSGGRAGGHYQASMTPAPWASSVCSLPISYLLQVGLCGQEVTAEVISEVISEVSA